MRRVACVRILVGDPGVGFEVVGMADRLPIVRPVPRRIATALIAAGVPAVIRRRPPLAA